MAFNMLPTGMSFQRLGQFPLDSSSLYNTLAEAMNYVQNNPTAYPGQMIYIADARTQEEIDNGVEAYESMHMITANKEIKLVVSSNDLDMDDMLRKFEEAVAKLEKQLEDEHAAMEAEHQAMKEDADAKHEELKAALLAHEEEANAKMKEMQDAADAKHEEIEKAMADMQAASDAKHKEMEDAAKAKHEAMEAKMEADHAAMREEAEAKHKEMQEAADAKHAEMTQAMTDMEARMEVVHEEMKAAADLIHGEMEAAAEEIHGIIQDKIEADHVAMKKEVEDKFAKLQKYEINNVPEGTLVDYRDGEIRIMCPKGAEFSKQEVGVGGNPNMFYMTFTTFFPDNAVTFKEGDKGVLVDEVLNFENTSGAGVDAHGRKFKRHWFALANFNGTEWNYFGKTSSLDKYIGWTYVFECYDENGVAIDADVIRLNLSNEDCHFAAQPYPGFRIAEKAVVDKQIEDLDKKVEDKMAADQAAMDAKHEAMEEAAKAKHAEMDKAMADMKAAMETKHAEMEADAQAKHEEMKAEADAEHKAMKELVDIEEPYMADVAAYPTSKFFFACGVPVTVEPNKGQKFDAGKPEDAVAFVYRWAEGFKAVVVEKEEAAKVYVVGGHGTNKVDIKRPIPQTNILVRDVKVKGVVGGSYFEGMVGHANIELNNAEVASVMGAGWCGASLNGKVARVNVVDDIKIIVNDSKVTSTLFGGPQGNGVADDVYIELNNAEVGWLTAGGANGMTRNAKVVMNGGSVKVAQSTNRGIVYKARFVMNDGVVKNLYFGGETEDNTVNGIIEDAFVELNNGVVNRFNFGTNNGVGMSSKDIKGLLRECVVEQGDVAMLEQFSHMFFGGDANFVPCANGEEIKALAGKERVDAEEVKFVVPVGTQRVTVAVPNGVEVKEIQYMGQGCVDYKDMFDESTVEVDEVNYKVFTYIFAIPCSAKMAFKVIL